MSVSLNHRQRTCLLVAGCFFAATLIYPPFSLQGIRQGFGWIISPPHPFAVIDVGMLLIEWGALLLMTSALMFILGRQEGIDALNEIGSDIRRSGLWGAILVLRLTRLLCGFILAFQLFGMLPILTWAMNPEAINGEALVTLQIKVVVAIVVAGIALVLRRLINWLNKSRTGSHDLLIPRAWSF